MTTKARTNQRKSTVDLSKVKQQPCTMAHPCNPAIQKAEIRRIEVQSQSQAISLQDCILKNPSQKMAGTAAQGRHLPNKRVALSSNPSAA
jgi:hypothetical protein